MEENLIRLRLVRNEEEYEKYIPENYKANYSYVDSESSLPWVVITGLKKKESTIKIFSEKLNDYCTMGDACLSVGTLSTDKKTLTVTNNDCLMFETINDLNVPGTDCGEFRTNITNEDGEFTAVSSVKLTVVPGINCEDSVLKINNLECQYGVEQIFNQGDEIQITVEREGYGKFEKTFNIESDTIETIDLTELVKPVINCTLPETIIVGTETEFEVTTTPNDYKNILVTVIGNVSNTDSVKLYYITENNQQQLMPFDSNGNFTFGPATGFPLLPLTSKFKLVVENKKELNFSLELKNFETKKVLATYNSNLSVVEENPTSNLTVNIAESSKEGAVLTVNGETTEFDTTLALPVGTEAEVVVVKEGYVTYVQKVLIEKDEDKTITVELEKKTFEVNVKAYLPDTTEDILSQCNVTTKVNDVELIDIVDGKFNVEFGDKVNVTIELQHYEIYTYENESVSDNVSIEHTFVPVKYTLTVNTEPEAATVKINGIEQNTIELPYESAVTVEVSKIGYKTVTETFNLTKDTEKTYTLELDSFKVSVATNPADAQVIYVIPGEEPYNGREFTALYGTVVNITVGKLGYISKIIEHTITDNETVNVELEPVMHDITFEAEGTTNLDNATIKIDETSITKNEEGKFVGKVQYGSKVTVSVIETGIKPYIEEITVTEDQTINVGEWRKPLVSVKTSDKNQQSVVGAVIQINGIVVSEGVEVEVNYDTDVNIEVSADGYNIYTETKRVTEDYAVVAQMTEKVAVLYTITVNTTPTDATVKINGTEAKTLEVEENTEVTVEVSKTGYETHTETLTVTDDVELNITLQQLKLILTVNTTPTDASVTLNGTNTNTIEVVYGTEVTVEVSKDGYETHTETVTITENKTLDITLTEETEEEIPVGPNPETFEKIKSMLGRKNYWYLSISKYLTNGITEDSLKSFYMEFGYYVMSRFDYKLWRLLHTYFGHIDGIQEPEVDQK